MSKPLKKADDPELITFINMLKNKYDIYASGDIQNDDNICYKVLFTNKNGTTVYFNLFIYSTLWGVWYKLDDEIISFGKKDLTLHEFYDKLVGEIKLPIKK